MKTYESRIPFEGFYESKYGGECDNVIESMAENEEWEDVDADVLKNELFDCCDFSAAHREIARHYVDAFFNWFNEQFGIAVDTEYKFMNSPREYNFETDKIFVNIPENALLELRENVDADALNKTAIDLFKSRSGFISFYPHMISEWPADVREWDHNQIFCLLSAYCSTVDDYGWTIYYAMDEKVYGAVSNAVNWEEFERSIAEWRADQTDEEADVDAELNADRFKIYPSTSDKAIRENLAAVDKDIVNTLRSTTNPAEYVRAFISLNHLKG